MNNRFDRHFKEHGVAVYGRRSHWRRLHVDPILLFLLVLLMGGGLVVLYSASGKEFYYVKRQLVFMTAGLMAMIFVAQIPPRLLERWAWLPYLGGVALLIAVPLIGVGAKGAQRWIDLGVFRFQPSELMKIALPLLLSSYLGGKILPPKFLHLLVAAVVLTVPAALVVLQPDLGTAILILTSGLFVVFLAGIRKIYLAAIVVSGIAAAPLMWFFVLHDYQKARVLTLLDPQSDKLGAGWNIIQSTTAIGSGGDTGKGWLQGTQSHLEFLPESHTDFIIAVLSEEFGLMGVLILLTLYLLIILRGLIISIGLPTMFGRLLAGSITLTFFVYIFVNMGMVSGLLPVVGVPLPMVSYGGTSIVTLLLGFGLLMSVGSGRKQSD